MAGSYVLYVVTLFLFSNIFKKVYVQDSIILSCGNTAIVHFRIVL